jgi:hypothetical protein
MGLGKGFTKETFKVGLRDEYVFWWNRGVGHIKHVIPGKTQLYYLLIYMISTRKSSHYSLKANATMLEIEKL